MIYKTLYMIVSILCLDWYVFCYTNEVFYIISEIHLKLFKSLILCNSFVIMYIITSIYLYYFFICLFSDAIEYIFSVKKKYILGVIEIFFIALLFIIVFKSNFLFYFEYLELSNVLKKLNIFLILCINVSFACAYAFFDLNKKESLLFFVFEFFILYALLTIFSFIKIDISFALNPYIIEHYLIFCLIYLELHYLFLESLINYFRYNYPKVIFLAYLRIVNLYVLLVIIHL